MVRLLLTGLAILLASGLSLVEAMALEKVRLGIAFKEAAHYELPVLMAEERGFWKDNGLEVEWFSFVSGTPLTQATVAGSIDISYSSASVTIQAASRGVPMVNLAAINNLDYFIWVRSDSPIRDPKDLKGAKIAVLGFGGMNHAYALFLTRSLGMDKEIKFVTVGGGTAEIGALKVGRIDGRVGTFQTMAPFELRGEVRRAIAISSYFPKEWVDNTIAAPRWFMEKKPEPTRRTVKASRQAIEFMLKDKRAAIEKIKSRYHYSEDVARAVYEMFNFSPDGKISRNAMENVRNFLVEYGIVDKEKTPPVEELYTTKFLE